MNRRSRVKQLNDFLGTNYKNLTDIDWGNSIKFYVDNSSKIATTWFFDRFKDQMDGGIVARNVKLSTEVMRRIRDYSKIGFSLFGGWTDIIEYQSIEEDFIDEFYSIIEEYVDEDDYWSTIFANQELTEGFIKDHCDKPGWSRCSGGQELSIKFLRKYKKAIDWKYFCIWRVITPDIYKAFKKEIEENLDTVFIFQPFLEYLEDNIEGINRSLKLEKGNNSLYNKYCENEEEFIGYVLITPLSSSHKYVPLFTEFPNIDDSFLYHRIYKVRIRWEDLIFTGKIEQGKYQVIREVKNISSTY